MPHIHINATCDIDRSQERKLIQQLGEAISLFPGMKPDYLMIRLEGNCRPMSPKSSRKLWGSVRNGRI